MTVTTQATQQTFIGDGTTKVFPYGFRIPSAQMAFLYKINADLSETLIPSSQYSLSGLNTDGGNLTYPLVGSALAVGEQIKLDRTMPFKQELDIKNQTGFLPEVVEQALDFLAMQIQQLAGLDASAGVEDITGILNDIEIPKTQVADLTERVEDLEAGLIAANSAIAVLQANAATMGTYTPTSVGTPVNVDSCTFAIAHWRRTGNQVDVWGTFTLDPTAAGSVTQLMNLPVASNIQATTDLAGMAQNAAQSQLANIDGFASSDSARINATVTDTSSRNWSYRFSYEVK